MQDIPRSAVVAMRNTAYRMLIGNAVIGNQRAVSWAQASLKTLKILSNGNAQSAAEFHASKGGYDIPTGWEAAWSALPDGVENYTLAQVQEFLTSKGLQLALNDVSNSDVHSANWLENGAVIPIDLHDEHDASRADLNNGSGLHDVLPKNTAILYMPQGAGKTAHAEAVAQLLGCAHIIDDWNPSTTVITPGALHLTHVAMKGGAA